MMKMIPTRKANIRAQKAEDEVWIILKIVCDAEYMYNHDEDDTHKKSQRQGTEGRG